MGTIGAAWRDGSVGEAIMKFIERIPVLIAGGALAVLVSITVVSVFARYLFGAPFHWLEEVSGLLMIWIVMVGAVSCERDGQHLAIAMLTDRLPWRLRVGVEIVVTLLSIIVLGFLVVLGWQLAKGAGEKLTDILEISWFWIDVAVPVGALGAAIYMVLALKRSLAEFFGKAERTTHTTSMPDGGNL
jgi:TRAP-type C4-dicarboxylate transport system permease small subunit